MAEKAAAERTEQPTPRRISKAREKGQVMQSEELVSAITLLAVVLTCALIAPYLLNGFTEQFRQAFSTTNTSENVFAGIQSFNAYAQKKIIDCFLLAAPFFLAIVAGSVAAGIAISGWNFAPTALTPKFESLNPVSNLQKLFDSRSAVRLAASIAKLIFISIIAWLYISDRLDSLAALRWAWSSEVLIAIAKLIFGLLIRVCIGLLVIGLADYAYQRWKYFDDLKMTRQEVKEERRDTEGAPEIKSKIRQIQFQMSRKRMLQQVPKASVVLVNPTHIAVALKYDSKDMPAPVVVAKGAGLVAEKIVKTARAYGVPVARRPELARTIYKTVEIGKAIPEVLYVAVAEVLAMIYRLRHRK